jgi:CARDB
MVRWLVIPIALALAAPATADAVLPASVRLADCSFEEGSAEFYGRMRQLEDSDRMSMRFSVLEKRIDGYEALKVPGLSRWHRSKPGVAAFGYRQTVRGLQPGGVYRGQVSFRWHSAEGELIGRTRRTSTACRQFDATPNLTTELVGAESTKVPGVMRYVLTVSNSGIAPAVGVEVRLSVDDSVVDTLTIASLDPGDSRELAVRGPACTSTVGSVADPDGVIVESSETDNGDMARCAELHEP